MSPEQARRETSPETNRVDERSDIYSLGVVLFEMLTGFRPFEPRDLRKTKEERQAIEVERTKEEGLPIPSFSELKEGLPSFPERLGSAARKNLEAIVQKSLQKKITKRFQRAYEFAKVLEDWLAEVSSATGAAAPPTAASPRAPAGDDLSARCQGLVSFSADQASFFLDLLPGPRDPDTGLPESVLFWRNRILETDRTERFTFGVIYGPSGCGKTSLVKAALLPRLIDDARALKLPLEIIRLDATAHDTERELLDRLRTTYRPLSGQLDLGDTLWALTGRDAMPADGRLLIVLDQFEQWLNAHSEPDGTELVRALRRGVGGRMKCLVMIRTEFLLGGTRFMQAVEGHVMSPLLAAITN